MIHDVGGLVALLAVSMLVAILARRLRLPYTVGLVAVGAALAVAHAAPPVALTHDLIFDIVLPPLLFEAALTLRWSHLRADAAPILLLAIAGTLISAAVTTGGMMVLLGWPLTSALVFGVLIAATDPVSVIALFKDLNVHGRVRVLVEAESLFNDGAAAVLFVAALSVAGAGAPLPQPWPLGLAAMILGGMALGAATAGAAILVAGRTADRLVETALTVVVAWGSFALAETAHVSGVLATVTAGLVLGNLGVLRNDARSSLTPEGRRFVLEFWDFAAFLANSLIFPLIGAAVAATAGAAPVAVVVVAIGVVLASRALAVYALAATLRATARPLAWREQHVLFWGGLRGALGLALALALPPDLPLREAIVVAAFGVAAFSIVVQGLTMPWLLRRLGIARGPAAKS